MTETILSIRDLKVSFKLDDGVVNAVRNISLNVKAGECLGVVGESGSGKSQTFLAAMGLLAGNGAATGSIQYRGKELLGLKPQQMNTIRGSKMTMIFQDPLTALTPHMKIGDQICEPLIRHLGYSPRDAMTEAADWLRKVRISDVARRLRQYRRAGLAGASPRHAAVRPPAAAATAPEPHHAQCGAAQLPLPLTAELPPPLLRRPALRPDRLLPHLWHLRVAVCAGRCQRIRRPGDAFQQWERDVGAAAGCSFAAPFRPQARVVVQCGVQHDGRRR